MRLGLLLTVLLLLLASPVSALAQTSSRSVSWQQYDTDLVVAADGSIQVTETQTIAFQGTYQQGNRVIPTDRTSGITDVSVAELSSTGQTTPLAAATSMASDGVHVTWNFAPVTNASRTFVLRYTAHDATRVYSGGNQIDWNAIYADRAGPIAASTVTIHLPGDVTADAIMTALYQVPVGRLPRQVGTATLVDARTLRFDVGSLPESTGAEVRAQVPRQVLPQASPPAWQAAADQQDWLQQTVAPIASFLTLLLSLAILAGGGIAVVLLWYSRVRAPAIGPVPPVLDQRPSDLAAPLVGTLVDGVADLQDAVAILLDLARTGVISLKEEVTEAGSDVRVVLHRSTEDPKLQRYERVLLVALFGRGVDHGEVLLSEVRGRFAVAVEVLEQRLYEAVVDAGLFTANPVVERQRYTGVAWIAIGIGVAGAVLAALLIGSFVPVAWLPGTVLLLLGLAVLWLARKMPRRTERGALEAARWRAFRTYLLQQRPARPSDALDATDLAYAVALGADRSFLRRLETAGSPPPQWYGANGGPGPVIFVPGGWYGGPGWGGHPGGWGGGVAGGAPGVPSGGGGAGGPQGWSDALADLLNAASGALSHGGGSGPWSGGGWGGGGGGGGGSGGFN